MTDSMYTHITVLADRSGSMDDTVDAGSEVTKARLATEGIHELIRKQAAEPGRVTFTLTQFDTKSADRIAAFAAAGDPRITEWRIQPRGGTPLLDAVATEIVMTGEDLAQLPEDRRPSRVFFVIGTDGEENSSHEYTRDQVANLVRQQREQYGWDFVFIGADFDAFAEAGSMGVAAGSTLTTNSASIGAAYASTNSAMSRARAGGQSVSYTDAERDKAAGTP